MGRQEITDQQAGFSGGLNSVADPAFLRPDQARAMTNFRLSPYGAALRRLGTKLVQTNAVTQFDTVGSVYGGIYWPLQAQAYLFGAATNSTAGHIYSTTYGTFPLAWTDIGALPQYRPVIFTDDTQAECLYVAGNNTIPVYKAVPALATITVDATSSGQTSTATVTWSHTFGAGTNRLLVVGLTLTGTTGSSVVVDPTGLNLSLTKLGSFTPSGVPETVEYWYLVAPPQTGALNIKATMAGASTAATAFSLTAFGVNQTQPFETINTVGVNGFDAPASNTIPVTIGDLVIDAIREQNLGVLTAGSGQTLIGTPSNGNAASYKFATDISATMTWVNPSLRWSEISAAIRQAPSTPSLTITALPGTSPFVKGLCVYNDRLWGWNSFNRPNSLFFSDLSATIGSVGGDSLGNPALQGGEIVVETFGPSAIVVCAPVNGSLVIWHQRGISILTGWGQDDTEVKPQALNADIGMSNATADGVCVANELSTGDIAYFITNLGLYKTNGATVLPVGTPEKPDPLVPLLQQGIINPSQCILTFNRQFQEVWVALSFPATPGFTLPGMYVYNVILGSWSGPFDYSYAQGVKKFFNVDDSAGKNHLWRIAYNGTAMAGLTVSECDWLNSYTDDIPANNTVGFEFQANLQLRRMFGSDPAGRSFSKSWRWINLTATVNLSQFNVLTLTEYGGQNIQTITSISDPTIEHTYYISPGGCGTYIDVTIEDFNLNGSQYAYATVQGNLLGQR